MKDGILIINKPQGWTSQDVCAKLRSRLHIKKIGHTGTLDPMATGVLPVCIGKATRIIEYYDLDRKSYHAGMQLGVTSDTLDIWGDVRDTGRVIIKADLDKEESADRNPDLTHVTQDDILKAFSCYRGIISQVPPKYSALRIDGKRAYDLAREGRDFEIKAREVVIYSNEVTSIDEDNSSLEFDVTCSKGTYIRTICDDIGSKLGCGAVMSSLVRTASGVFRIEDALSMDQIMQMSDEEIEKSVIPMDKTLSTLGKVTLNDNRVIAFTNGNSSNTGYKVTEESSFVKKNDNKYSGVHVYRVYNRGRFLGTALIASNALIPDKVIQ